jgi:hypothetical protein
MQAYDGYDDADEDLVMIGASCPAAEDGDDTVLSQVFNAPPTTTLKSDSIPFTQGLPSGDHGFAQIDPRASLRPVIASNPPSVSFENPAISSFYEAHPPGLDGSMLFIPQQQQRTQEVEKPAWNTRIFTHDPTPTQLQLLHLRSFLSSANPTSGNASNAFVDATNQSYFAGVQRSPPHLHSIQSTAHFYASPEDDASSVGSGYSGRQSSGSSGRCCSPLSSLVTFELSSPCESTAEFSVSKRLGVSSIQLPSVPGWCRPTNAVPPVPTSTSSSPTHHTPTVVLQSFDARHVTTLFQLPAGRGPS